MIDATTFAHSYNAFWQENTPMCEHFVRRLNFEELDRFEPPMADTNTRDRAYIAEFSFSLFVEAMSDKLQDEKRSKESVYQLAKENTDQRMKPYVRQGLILLTEFDDAQRREVEGITGRLLRFFSQCEAPIILRPSFPGCGYIDESEGDVICGQTLYEVKTVDRRFRSVDLRQVITYAALNFVSGQFSVESIGIFNPRRGLFFENTLDNVCAEISGRPAADLLAEVVETISSGSISR